MNITPPSTEQAQPNQYLHTDSPELLTGTPEDRAGRVAPAYFRTYEQVKAKLFDLQAKFPDLVEVRDIGDSAEKVAGKADRDILALVLTNKHVSGDKPSTLHLGGIHAREIANPELLLTYADQLLGGFGTDPNATMLLNTRETVLVPILNPDGHAVVERGFAGAPGGNTMQRKSTGGGDPSRGTDLNRNYDYHWGGSGASSNPSSDTYRGPAAGSEPETQAIQDYVTANQPDFFVDWHSYSRLNLYPWGDTRDPTKDHKAFQALAQKFTSYNGYRPIQAIQLYPTTGTTDDFAYARTGRASMAVETGSSFHQSDAEFAKTLAENLPILTYTAKVADAPFERVFGPDALDVSVDPATHRIAAKLTDANNGKLAIAGAEYVLDPAAAPGTGVPFAAIDGAFDAVDELVSASAVSVGQAADTGTLVYVRGKDAAGNWGPLTAQWLTQPVAANA